MSRQVTDIETARTLASSAHNVYSQGGEDGIIEMIFETIGTRSKICVEFGAWDGFYLSNTANLWTKGWHAVLIEADPDRYKTLVENVKDYDARAICARVGFSGADSLESILEREGINDTIDLLSIDIDGDDYYILASLERMRPRVVICEYNTTIPPHLNLVQEPGQYFGCSALALVSLAEEKGYKLVAATEGNCIFVGREEFHHFAEYETSLPILTSKDKLIYLITDYSGKYVLSDKPTFGFTIPYSESLRGEYCSVSVEDHLEIIAKPEMPDLARTVLKNPLRFSRSLARVLAGSLLRRAGLDSLLRR